MKIEVRTNERGVEVVHVTTDAGDGEAIVDVDGRGETHFERSHGPVKVKDGEAVCPNPNCGSDNIRMQEFVYSHRAVLAVEPDGTFMISGYSEEDGEGGLDSVLALLYCRSCGRGYDLPEGASIDYS